MKIEQVHIFRSNFYKLIFNSRRIIKNIIRWLARRAVLRAVYPFLIIRRASFKNFLMLEMLDAKLSSFIWISPKHSTICILHSILVDKISVPMRFYFLYPQSIFKR
jgi:hypothetical protein